MILCFPFIFLQFTFSVFCSYCENQHGIRAKVMRQFLLSWTMETTTSKTFTALNEDSQLFRMTNVPIPTQLKFLMSNMKSIISTQLTTENHAI